MLGDIAIRVVGRGSIRGALYHLGEYPGLVDADDDSRVPGMLLEFSDVEVLTRLDAYEGIGEGLYIRARAAVSLDDGSKAEAWVYRYAGAVHGRPRIAAWPP